MMTPTYLYPQRRRFEMIAALFAGGYGLRVLGLLEGNNPFAWAGFGRETAETVALVMVAAAFMHAIGIWINGRWRWSPVLRFGAMSAHATVFAMMAHAGAYQTAGYVYAWGVGLMLSGAYSAGRDSIMALRGEALNGPAIG